MSPLKLDTISLATFNTTVRRYPSTVPEKLQELDTLRYDTLPATLAKRDGVAYLKKGEVEKLVEWKLKHGTFRPKLLQLVQSNTAETIKQTTELAFHRLLDPDIDSSPPECPPLGALKTLTALKGIGPATASLLLSVAAPDTTPFFSDELFRWCMWDLSGSPSGWKRAIKYNVKEYEALYRKVGAVRERLGVRAVDVERVAWVLGKERVDLESEQIEDAKEEEGEKSKEVEKVEDVEEKPRKGTKRKATESKPTAEGTRKSARTRNKFAI